MSEREDDLATARTAYQEAIALWIYEGTGLWSVFSAMVTANAVIVAIETFLWDRPVYLAPLVSGGGLILCIAWFSITSRRRQIHDYRVLAAREIEERHLSRVAKTVSFGGTFSDGGWVSLRIGGGERPLRMEWPGRWSVKWVVRAVITLFATLHITLGVARVVFPAPRADEITNLTTMLVRQVQRTSELEAALNATKAEIATLEESLRGERELRQKLQKRPKTGR